MVINYWCPCRQMEEKWVLSGYRCDLPVKPVPNWYFSHPFYDPAISFFIYLIFFTEAACVNNNVFISRWGKSGRTRKNSYSHVNLPEGPHCITSCKLKSLRSAAYILFHSLFTRSDHSATLTAWLHAYVNVFAAMFTETFYFIFFYFLMRQNDMTGHLCLFHLISGMKCLIFSARRWKEFSEGGTEQHNSYLLLLSLFSTFSN